MQIKMSKCHREDWDFGTTSVQVPSWEFGTTSVAYGKTVQYSDNSWEEAAWDSGGMCFQAFVSSVSWKWDEERLTGVQIVLELPSP